MSDIHRCTVQAIMIRKALIRTVCILALLASSCISHPDARSFEGMGENPDAGNNWEEQGEVLLTLDQGLSPLEIIQSGFDAWLGQYTQEHAPDNVALLDYEFEIVEAVSDPFFAGDYDFVFVVEYAVRPKSESSRWLAGDGRMGTSGWIVGKSHYVGILIQDDQARVLILGPCPMC